MSSSEFLGFDNSFLHQKFSPTDQDHMSYFDTAREIQDSSDFLIQVHNKLIDEKSSWEEVASLLLSTPPRKPRAVVPELVSAECSVMEVSCYGSVGAFMQRNYGHNYLQTKENFPFGPHFDRASESKNSNNRFLGSICSNEEFEVSKNLANHAYIYLSHILHWIYILQFLFFFSFQRRREGWMNFVERSHQWRRKVI